MRRIFGYCKGMALIVLMHFIEHSLGGRMEQREANKVWWWVLIAALAILVIRLLSGCTSVPVQTASRIAPDGTQVVHDTVYAFFPTVLELDSSSRNDGVVECAANNVPYIRIKRVFFPDSMARLRRLLLIHEEAHVAQGIAFGNCVEWRRKISLDAAYHFDQEAIGYCATWNAEAREDQPHWWSKQEIAEFLRRTIFPAYTIEEALARLPCTPGG